MAILPATETAASRRRSAEPVSPGATPAVREVLSYLYELPGRRILSGQEESTWNGGPEYEMDYILRATGKLPAIRGMDQGTGDYVGRAIDWWNAGGIPSVAYHMGAPTFDDSYEGCQQAVSIDAVLTVGTPEHTSFMERLDAAAANLERLQDAGAAVIWRPFHEAGGAWFWWSMEGGAQYRRLWRHTFDHLTGAKGLKNLIWLLAFNGEPDPSFHPGRRYVDLVGADTYATAGDYGPLDRLYAAARAAAGDAVPVALHENGPIPAPERLRATGANWLYFNTWNSEHLTESNSVDHLRRVYHDDMVVTRDELPDFGRSLQPEGAVRR